MIDRNENDTQEGSRVEADPVSAYMADLLDDKRATIRDAAVESTA